MTSAKSNIMTIVTGMTAFIALISAIFAVITQGANVFKYFGFDRKDKIIAKNGLPNLDLAVRKIPASHTDDFRVIDDNDGQLEDVSGPVPGYFNLHTSKSGGPYSYACAVYKDRIEGKLFLSARISEQQGTQTMELRGSGVVFGVGTSTRNRNSYFVYESEANWTTWRKLPFSRDDRINTYAMFQQDRDIIVYLNGKKITTFSKLHESVPDDVGLCFKANSKTGGSLHFQKLSIWEF